MGLSSFNRMRRERAGVEKIEAERFKADNEARQARRLDRVEAHEKNADRNAEVAKAEAEVRERIGEKARAGLDSKVPDEPLRRDHAAEIAGRDIEGVQEPKDPIERVDERIPDGTANEELVPMLTATGEGPTAEQVEAARQEAGAVGGQTEIPSDWQSMSWPARRSLAAKLSDNPISNSDDANAAIEAEVVRRND